jgi:fatty acid synthase subunit alpha, fungi type
VAEDIEAIFNKDPQHVCILQGPVAVKNLKVKDEPIKDLLGNINSYLIHQFLECQYWGDESKIPTVDYLSPKPIASSQEVVSLGVEREVAEGVVSYSLGKDIPDASLWLEILAGSPHLDNNCPGTFIH